ncbi:MAG: AsmA-like C-terminal region-containing protein [Saprospiraceae bacterium]
MKLIKRIALWFGLAFLILFVASIVIAVVFEDEIGQKLVTEINKGLVNDLEVENFRLSLIKGFPYVNADLQNVVLPDNRKGVLLEANTMSFKIGLLGLLTSNLKIESVVVENGALFIEVDRKGKANYFISKPSAQNVAAAEVSFALSLDKATLKDIELIYIDERSKQEMKLQLEDVSFSGKFNNDQFSLISDAKIYSNFVELDGRRYFVGKDLGYDAKMYVDLENNFYEFQEMELAVAKNNFSIFGIIEPHTTSTEFDLEITSKKGNIESVIQLLPEEYQYLEGFASRGNFTFDATIKGISNARENPTVDVNFGLVDGEISHTVLESSVKDVSFAAHFKSGKSRAGKDALFEINNFKGYFNRELIESQLKLTNLENPIINLKLDGTLPLESIYTLFDSPIITDGDGEMEIRNLELEGRYEDMINPSRIHRVKSSGTLEFDDAELTINGEDLVLDRGILELRDNELKIEELKLEGAGSEVVFGGYANNFLPVLLADSINSKDAKLRFKATLESKNLDLDRLVGLTEVKVEEGLFRSKGVGVIPDSIKQENIHRKEVITNFLEGTFEANVESFNYNLIEGESFNGNLEFKNKQMSIIGEAGAMGGSFDIDGTGYFEKLPKFRAKIICNDINAKEFFRQGQNFGQEVLVSRHIEGTLNANMIVSATFDTEGNLLYDELRVIAGVGVTDGELNNFELLEDFSAYANSDDLGKVRFVDMQNWFEIKNERIYIPVMFIQTNAMNMLLSGEHTFNNDIDYNIKVNAGQILMAKLKNKSGFKPQPAKKKGLFNLYFNVAGTIDDYAIETNRKKVKKEFTFSEYKKEAVQKALANAFSKPEVARELRKRATKIPDFKDTEGKEEFLDEIEGGRNN